MSDGDIDIVVPRTPEGLSIVLKPRHGSRLYRVVPIRDPETPRFWCLIVLRCTRAGAVEADAQPWVIGSGLTRDEVPARLAEIQDDLPGWLAKDGRQGLHRWLMEQLPDPLDVMRACGETRRRTNGTGAAWDATDDFISAMSPDLAVVDIDRG